MAGLRRIAGALRILDRAWLRPHQYAVEESLERELVGHCETVLDVACGADSPLGRLKGRFVRTVGVDAFQPSLERSAAAGLHHEYRCIDVLELDRHFPSRSFDAVILIDLIEHLTRSDGDRLLAMAEGIARRKVIVFTPNGFVPQEPYEGNEFQRHLSGWSVSDMEDRGYRVVGVNGWKALRGERAEIRWPPRFFWTRVSWLSQRLIEKRPRRAYQLFCVKELDGEGERADA